MIRLQCDGWPMTSGIGDHPGLAAYMRRQETAEAMESAIDEARIDALTMTLADLYDVFNREARRCRLDPLARQEIDRDLSRLEDLASSAAEIIVLGRR